jgi:cytochrome bd-type quinol oxidase subunit 2
MNLLSIQSFLKKYSQFLIGMFFAAILFFSVGDTMAAPDDPFGLGSEIKLDAASGQSDLRVSLVEMLNYFLVFIGIILVMVIVYAGFIIIMSQGDDEKLTEGRKIIVYALIGVVIIFLSYTIVNFIGGVVNADETTTSG